MGRRGTARAAVIPDEPVPAGEPLLTCRDIAKAYGSTRAVDGVDFDVYGGEVHALLGENGAGKSTLIKILAGTVKPDRGAVTIAGQPVDISGVAAAWALGIGVTFQELSLAPDLSVAENLWLHEAGVTRLGMMSRRVMRAKTIDLFERFGARGALLIDPDRKVRDLSLAQKSQIEILRVVSRDPRILILDEATAALPAAEAAWLIQLARDFAARGRAVIFISHRMNEVLLVGDRITILRGGIRATTAARDELNPEQIIEAILGRKPQRLYPPPAAAPRDRTALTLRDFSVADAVLDVSLQVREGEILGIGGLEGNGQSELLQGLFGVRESRGEVFVAERRASLRTPRTALKSGIGLALIPEDRKKEGLLLKRSIRENLTLAVIPEISRFGLIDRRAERRVASAAMDRFKVVARSVNQPAGSLSGGNQQKIVIAKLLAVGAKVLLFHDLTRGVDVGTKAEIFALARTLTADGYTILMYSSDNEELINMCDRIAVLRRGEIAALVEGDDRSEQAIMRAALGVEREPAAGRATGEAS